MPSSFLLPVSLEYRYDSWSSILEHEDVSQSQGCQSSKLSSESWAIVEPSYQSQPSTSEFFFFFFFWLHLQHVKFLRRGMNAPHSSPQATAVTTPDQGNSYI